MKKKEFKCLSHAERMMNKEVAKVTKSKICVDAEGVYVQEQEVNGNRIVNVMKVKHVDPRENVKGFKVSDFSLDNLTACGAAANLKFCTAEGSVMQSIDSAVNGLSALENINISE